MRVFTKILKESDGIMIARGDLGVEIPIEKVPLLQKEMIEKCRQQGKPVITATQMMESMMDNLVPSRADVSDVANAVFDLTDAVMLSGETAGGNYPIQVVKKMARILEQSEKQLSSAVLPRKSHNRVEAMVQAAMQMTYFTPKQEKKPSLIVVLSKTGSTVRLLSRLKPKIPILALVPSERVRDELILTWGVTPYFFDINVEALEFAEIFWFLKNNRLVKRGDLLIVLSGEIENAPGKAHMVTLKEVWDW